MARSPQDEDEFEEALRRAWEIGRRLWPRLDLSVDVFLRHLGRLLRGSSVEGSPAQEIEQLDLEGLYLACACVTGVPMAVEAFEKHYMARLPGMLAYLKLPDAIVDEVCQQVRMLLLVPMPEGDPRLATYTGTGALMVWIRVIAVRLARRLGGPVREPPDERGLATIEHIQALGEDPEMELMKRRHRQDLSQAMRDAFAHLPERHQYLLRLRFVEGLTTTQMGPLFGKDQSTVSRWLKEVRQQMYEETKRLLKERLRLSSREFESLLNAIDSGFDESLSQILGSPEDDDEEKGADEGDEEEKG